MRAPPFAVAALLLCVALAASAAVSARAAVTCDTLTSVTQEPNTYPFAVGTNFADPVAASITSGQLLITAAANKGTSSAGWLSRLFRVVNGFKAVFKFRVTNKSPAGAEGFAFVLQRQSTTVVGGASANLGYNFANNIAVEFDMFKDSTVVDTDSNHVEVHTRYGAGTNSADNNQAKLPSTSDRVTGPSSNPQVDMANGNTYTVTIVYSPSAGTITVQVGSGAVLTTAVSVASIDSMFLNGQAYVGFTGSSSDSVAADVTVSDFELWTVGVDPAQSYLVGGVTGSGTIAAIERPAAKQATVQLVDRCGSPLPISYGPSIVTASVASGATLGTTEVVDLANGQYDIYWWSRTPLTNYVMNLRFNGLHIQSSPFSALAVVAGRAFGPKCTVTTISTSWRAGVPQSFTVTLRDALGNPTKRDTGFFVEAGFQSGSASDVLSRFPLASSTSTSNAIPISLSTNNAQTGVSLLVRLVDPAISPNRDIVGPLTVTVSPGAVSESVSQLISTTGALSSATAGQTANLLFLARDSFGNSINGGTGVTLSGKLVPSAGSTGLVEVPLGVGATPTASSNEWPMTYSTTKAGVYELNVAVGVNKPMSTKYTVTINPAGVSRGDVTAAIPVGVAGAVTSFTIQAYDEHGNARNAPNEAGKPFVLTVTPAGVTGGVAVTCGLGSAAIPEVVSGLSCAASSVSGQYVVSLTPLKAISYSVALAIGSTASQLSFSSFSARPGLPSAARSIVAMSASAVAGTAGSFTVEVRDANDNVRTNEDDRAAITFKELLMSTPSGSVTIVPSEPAASSTGVYTFPFAPVTVGTYALTVKLSGSVVGPALSTTVAHGALVPSKCETFGEGLRSGVGLAQASFNIRAKDNNNNIVTAPVTFSMTTQRSGGTASPSVNAVAVAGSPGLYLITYDVPVFSATNPDFTINLSGTPVGGAPSPVGVFTATSVDSGDISYATALGVGTSVATAGDKATFEITDRDSEGRVVSATTVFPTDFSLVFTSDSGATVGLATMTCANGASNCNPVTATYTPTSVGTYRMTVLDKRVVTEESKSPGYTVVVGPGAMHPPSTVFVRGASAVAGEEFTFTAALSDQSGNMLPTSTGVEITFATVATYTLPAVTNYGNGTYIITLRFRKSGAQRVLPLVSGDPTNGFDVNVAAGPLSGSGSTWGAISPASGSGVVTAGSRAQLVLTVKDEFDNPVSTLPSCTVALTLNSAMVTSIAPTTDAHVWTLSFVPTGANYSAPLVATVTCGVALTNPPTRTVSVRPAAADGSRSVVTGLSGATFTVGSPLSFRVQVRDALGNGWRTENPSGSASVDQAKLLVRVSATLDLIDKSVNRVATVQHDDSLPGQGWYTVSYVASYSGLYSFAFSAILLSSSSEATAFVPATGLVPVAVVAGAPVLRNSVLPPGSRPNDISKVGASIPAGSNFSVTIGLRDAMLNPLSTGGLADQLVLQFFNKSGETYCGEGNSIDRRASMDAHFSHWIVDNGDGTYELRFATTLAGSFWFDLAYVDSQGLQTLVTECLSIPDRTAFAIAPLAADPAHTLLSPIFNGRAGDDMSFTVTLRDKFDNVILPADHTITLGAEAACVSSLPPLTQSNSGAVVTGPFGASKASFTVTFRVQNSSMYVVPVLLDGALAARDNTACPTVFVRPAYISNVRISSLGGAAITAGMPATLLLETFDRFGNAIYSSQNAPVFAATFRRLLSSDYVVSNSSRFTGNTSFPHVDISFAADGLMDVAVRLPKDPQDPTSIELNLGTFITVLPAACAATAPDANTPPTPYRCPDTRECKGHYSECTGYVACPGFTCPNTGACANSLFECGVGANNTICTNGTMFCATNAAGAGFCALPQRADGGAFKSACPLGTQDGYCASLGLPVDCGSGVCRRTPADCPTSQVCPPFTIICPNGRSCAVTPSACPPLPTVACAAPRPFQCRDSRCVSRAEDCATEKTCAANLVLCPDGSCRGEAAECRETFTCLFDQVMCPNGECRMRLQDCPSSTVCAPGEVLCENGACSKSVAQCDAAPERCDTGVRCADGTCRPNRLQCPTLKTCPQAYPVLCADGTCVADVMRCRAARACPASSPFLCPDGTCALVAGSCPTEITCPFVAPTRCADGSCVATVEECPLQNAAPASCPPHRPFRCADGSCAGSVAYCPTKPIKCGAAEPVLCPDRSCVSSVEMCSLAAVAPCPGQQVRCPTGGCALAPSLCPTQVSCGAGFVRGADGSCRPEAELYSNTTTVTWSYGSTKDCADATGKVLVRCPQSHQGHTCAASLADCPQDVTCPRSRPVRCSDASCALSLEDCIPVLSTTLTVCAASTTVSSGDCGRSTTCPPSSPVKCWDESCRMLPEDCPPPARCDPLLTPYLCSNGECVDAPSSCPLSRKCPQADKQIKCPWTPAGVQQCVGNVTQCVDLFRDQPASTCPDSLMRCRDGYCSTGEERCSPLLCPPHIPVACPSGLCVGSAAQCPADNGCPYDATHKCADGSCAAKAGDCPSAPAACDPLDESVKRCADGSCPLAGSSCTVQSSGCEEGESLCLDGQCAPAGECTGRSDLFNACPAWRPFRCADGFCAVSSSRCPIVPYPAATARPQTNAFGVVKGVRCADGSMAAFGAQCPTVRPCTAGQVRCGNGVCRAAGQCPAANTCLRVFPGTGVRCASGYCAPTQQACVDSVLANDGCPEGAAYKCDNGACVTSASQCAAQPHNGCSAAEPHKCFDGRCVADAATCPAANGCPASTPFLCANGQCSDAPCTSTAANTPCANGVRCPNGQCADRWSQCQMSNGCPVLAPRRCADGSCASAPATAAGGDGQCPLTVVCDASAPFQCADYSCVAHASLCRPVMLCPADAPSRCAGFGFATCFNADSSNSTASCPAQVGCPAASPVLCADGACVTSVAQCSDRTAPVCPAGQLRCFDGSCAATPLECAAIAFASFQAYAAAPDAAAPSATFSPNAFHDNSTCATPSQILCADGSCVTKAEQCGPVPACPVSLPFRCPNGACSDGAEGSCAPFDSSCPALTTRCEDGLCRQRCLSFVGCPASKPFACFGRKESCTADKASCAALSSSSAGGSASARRRLLQEVSSSTGGAEPAPAPTSGQETCINCQNSIPAAGQSVRVARDVDMVIDVSVDSAFVPRTQLLVPAGSLGPQVAQLSVTPVAPLGLSSDRPPAFSSMTEGPYPFSAFVLSTPFRLSLEAADGSPAPASFQGGVQVLASIDNILFDPFAPTDGTAAPTVVPCDLQGKTFAVSQDSSIYTADSTPEYSCSGTMTLTALGMRLSMGGACDSIDVEGTYIGEGGSAVRSSVWDSVSSISCNCFNITASAAAQPAVRPPYAPRFNASQPWRRYEPNTQLCMFVEHSVNNFRMSIYTDARATAVCPTGVKQTNALFYQMSTANTADGCAGKATGGNRPMPSNDICLATMENGAWRCLEPSREARLANPSWSAAYGRPKTRVNGTVSTAAHGVLAFAYIPLPPVVPPKEPECDLWCQYKWVIIGVIIGVGAFLLIAAYVISRLIRYRRKYLQNKKDLRDLKERAREIDEFAGGLGVADEDVDMMANPMVIEMKKLDQQLTEVNLKLDTQAEQDSRTIDQLSQDRERLHAELTRVKALMAQQQKTTATRLEDVHVSQPHLSAAPGPSASASSSSAAAVASPSGLVPMEMESGAEGAPAGQERHGFAQVRRPNKKKEDL